MGIGAFVSWANQSGYSPSNPIPKGTPLPSGILNWKTASLKDDLIAEGEAFAIAYTAGTAASGLVTAAGPTGAAVSSGNGAGAALEDGTLYGEEIGNTATAASKATATGGILNTTIGGYSVGSLLSTLGSKAASVVFGQMNRNTPQAEKVYGVPGGNAGFIYGGNRERLGGGFGSDSESFGDSLFSNPILLVSAAIGLLLVLVLLRR